MHQAVLLQAQEVRASKMTGLLEKVATFATPPVLKVVLVGNDPASIRYTKNKKKFCEQIGASCEIIKLDAQIEMNLFLKTIKQLNDDQSVNGIIIQLPLPSALGHLNVGELISPEKDVDGFHPLNTYALYAKRSAEKTLLPCTPKGIVTLLNHYQIKVAGKLVLVLGRSLIVGRPMSLLLSNLNATVVMAHSQTNELRELTKKADLIVSAMGKAEMIDETYFSPTKKPVLIDVGMNLNSRGELCGDVAFEKVLPYVSAITPVPGGVGPMTILSLAENLILAKQLQGR